MSRIGDAMGLHDAGVARHAKDLNSGVKAVDQRSHGSAQGCHGLDSVAVHMDGAGVAMDLNGVAKATSERNQ